MAVDEKELGKMILAKGSILIPGAWLFIAYYVFAGNQWLAGPFSLALAAAYQINGWDGRHLLAWGIGALALAALIIGTAQWTANVIAIAGYWLCLAGILRMGSEIITGRAGQASRQGQGAEKDGVADPAKITGGMNKEGKKGAKGYGKGRRSPG